MAETKGLTWEELEALGFTIVTDKKGNKRIDFTKPPVGRKFVPLPTDDDYIDLKGIDRRFVSRKHKFSATTTTVVMELVDEETEGAGADAYIAMEKAEAKKAERQERCVYVNPETGNETYCPDCISCYGEDCPKKKGIQVYKRDLTCIDDMSEIIKSCTCSDDPVADQVMADVMWSDFKKILRRETPSLADIIEWDEYGYRAEEIMQMCGKQKKDTSWYYYQWKRIRDRWKKYYND